MLAVLRRHLEAGVTCYDAKPGNFVVRPAQGKAGKLGVDVKVLTIQPAAITTDHTLTMPAAQGVASTYLKNNGSGSLTWAATGDASGPSSSTDNAVARFDSTTGKSLQNSAVTISDTADIAGVKTLALSGSTSGVLTVQPAATTTTYAVTMPAAQGGLNSLLSNNGAGVLSWASLATGGGIKNVQVFNSGTGAFTYTPTAGTSSALVYITGGGGGGGGALSTQNNSHGSGGNSGATVVALLAVSDATTGTITIGGGGVGTSGGNGRTTPGHDCPSDYGPRRWPTRRRG
jgi:hypothetical protein